MKKLTSILRNGALIGFVASGILPSTARADKPLHTEVVEPIIVPGSILPTKIEAGGVIKEKPDVGNWFTRKVYEPDDGKKQLYALEILYCPTDKPLYTECRVAVVWSRNGSGGLGPQVDAPPSPLSTPQVRAAFAANRAKAAADEKAAEDAKKNKKAAPAQTEEGGTEPAGDDQTGN